MIVFFVIVLQISNSAYLLLIKLYMCDLPFTNYTPTDTFADDSNTGDL